eukprot:COSAG01_NODE_8066_length_2933_cov_3.447424_3_plen_57_part_00
MEMMGLQPGRIVGKSQPVLMMINPMIAPRDRIHHPGMAAQHSPGERWGSGEKQRRR